MSVRILAIAVLLASPMPAHDNFKFQKGDRVCIIGNSLADRLQHNGWMEAIMQSGNKGMNLSFRNLGVCGDQVQDRPRSEKWLTPEKALALCKADVIFAFFGYNESFAGEAGLAKYKKNLEDMIQHYQAQQFNGRGPPRMVLFSPLAYETGVSPLLPDGKEINAKLLAYSNAMKEVAKTKRVFYVDLYHPSLEIYCKSSGHMTINGVHLNDEGMKKIFETVGPMFSSSMNHDPVDAKKLENLRLTIINKDVHWYNRYRATDGNDIWGSRSTLKFVDGQTNADVLQRELEILDIMTDNLDRDIWQASSHMPVDMLKQVPPPKLVVKSNIAKPAYLGSEASMARMKLPKGYAVNLFASEEQFPELVNPVQMEIDGKNRLWVATWKTYPKWEPNLEMDDRLLILPDDNHDGKADKVITFAKVHNPTGFVFWNGGVIVASAPDLLFLKDNDGDDRADEIVHLLQGLDSADTHHAANNLHLGPDGALYFQSGVFMMNNIETPWGPALKTTSSGMFRLDLRSYKITFHAGNEPNPHGSSFDHWGYHYATDGTTGRAYQVVLENGQFAMKSLFKKKVRPVPASGIISSQNFPPESNGRFILLNVIGFQGIKQYALDINPNTGLVKGNELEDLLVSSDPCFRPSNFEFASDGTLLVSDWCNAIIGHMQHNIRDPNRDHEHGRIYRLRYLGGSLSHTPRMDGLTIENLLTLLEDPLLTTRERARTELSRHDTSQVIEACGKWLAKFDYRKREDAHHLLEGLWLCQQHGRTNLKLLAQLLESPELHARQAARVVQHYWNAPLGKDADAEKIESKQKPMRELAKDVSIIDINISTIVEKMMFDKTEFAVKAGQKVRLVLHNPDFMPHNLVIVQPGAAEAVGNMADQMGAVGFDRQFIPTSDKILYHTKLVEHGESEVLEFVAPTVPGLYEYICTFPGHWRLMRGAMLVVKS